MHEWIAQLGPAHRVLDLGAGAGSLKAAGCACPVISVDCDKDAFAAAFPGTWRVVAAGESLPFPEKTFDLIICHHVLEHVARLPETLAEISRVLKPSGRLYVSVPNGYGLCDGIYRFVFEGGDHVNRFRKAELIEIIERRVGLQLTRWQKLYSSFAYLNRLRDLDRAMVPKLAPRLRAAARVPAKITIAVQAALYLGTRAADRMMGVDWALYGWSLYFERSSVGVVENAPFVNVCLSCGSGHPARDLQRTRWIFYRCPTCNRRGIYFPPFRNGR